jgi:phosphoserine phosphatase
MESTSTSQPVTSSHLTDEQMRMILDVSRMLAVPTDLDKLLVRIAEISCDLIGCERTSIFLHDPARNELWTKVALQSSEIRVQCHKGIVGHSFIHNAVVNVVDPYNDSRFNPEPDRGSGFRTRSLLCAPMKGLDGKPIGAIEAINKHEVPFRDHDVLMIQLLADQAGVAVQRNQLQVEAVHAAAMRREMDLARRAQEALIPKLPPPIPGIRAVGWTLPASATGGDCFDLWRLSDGRLGILLADASGHGLAPAMIVSQARTLVRAMCELGMTPHDLLGRVNARLSSDLECGQFVTAFLAFLSPGGELQWSSAGHGPVFARFACNQPLETLNPTVPPLGIQEEWDATQAPQPVALPSGGSLIVVSDGIFEAMNANHELFGIERMIDALDRHQACAPREVLNALRSEVEGWLGAEEPADDQTIVVVQRE